ncbi:uncharacterized protein [Pseudorasbora parva]|uniref:uncharacterized protein n=1 Tax=Pseudorasbora parva TaxID=51549 RepID=UPI00351DCDE2
MWIHPHTPEDSLDRACGRVWKRSALASKGVWPHLPENAHVFADENCGIQNYIRGNDDSLTQRVRHQKLDKVMLMTQHNMTQTALQGHMDVTCPSFPDDRYSHGHEPDKTKETINQEDADRRKIEKFPKQIHLAKKATTKDIPKIPSNEDFPPLASLSVNSPPKQAAVSKSGSYKAILLKGKPNIQLHCGKPQRAQNQKEHPGVKPHPSAKTTPKIDTKKAQGFIAQPGSLQTGSVCREKVIREGQQCSILPMFAQFQKAEEQIIPKDRTFKGGYVELGRSADGAHMAQTQAGSGTGSVKNTAGPLDNAKCHIYHKDASVAKTKTTGPGPDMSMPGNMDGIQAWNSSGRCPLQNGPFFTGTGHGPQSSWLLPANCFLWFSEMDPMYMAVNSQFASNLLPPPGFGLNPYYIRDFSLWPYQHGNSVIFPPADVNPSAVGRHRFTCPANGKVDLLCSLRGKL